MKFKTRERKDVSKYEDDILDFDEDYDEYYDDEEYEEYPEKTKDRDSRKAVDNRDYDTYADDERGFSNDRNYDDSNYDDVVCEDVDYYDNRDHDDAEYEEADNRNYEDADYNAEYDYDSDDDRDYEDADYNAEYDYDPEDDRGYEDADYYEDREYEDREYDDRDYDDEEYDYEPEDDRKRHRGGIIGFLAQTTAVERIAAGFALAIIAGGIATASFYASAMSNNKRLDSFAEVGASLGEIDVIGQSGLIAIADAEKARAMAAELVSEDAAALASSEEEEVVVDTKEVEVKVKLSSIKSDMKVKFVNTATGKLIADTPFEIEVETPDGSKVTYNDHDQDGIIYKKDITAGEYKITPKKLPQEYEKYKLDTKTRTLTVKDQVEMKAVDVSDEVKKESQVNVAKEDTAVKNETESQLQDTVEWVESTKTPIGEDGSEFTYEQVDKSSIVNPTSSSSLVWGDYFKYAFAGSSEDGSSAGSITFKTNEESTIIDMPTDEDEGGSENSKPGDNSSDENTGKPDDSSSGGKTDKPDDSGSSGTTKPDESTTEITTIPDDSSDSGSSKPSDSGEGKTVIVIPSDEDSGNSSSKQGKVPMDITKLTILKGQKTKLSSSKKGLKISLESSDAGIVSVSGTEIKGEKEGKATITVSAKDYEDATVEITVASDKTTLKDKNGNVIYIKNAEGKYIEATYADYNKDVKFYIRKAATTYRYTGWQTIEGKTYFFDKNGNFVTGEQVINGAKYVFGSDGVLQSSAGVMGIDVSKWNGDINWAAVKNSGVSFVIIRCGYRGSSQGALIEDPRFRANISGATKAGLRVGVYFFTQAVNEVEAVEEASMVINLVKGYSLSYPVYLDVEASNGRGDQISASQRTANIKAFCGTIQNAGYRAGVYANKTWLTSYINTAQITNYKIWLAQYAATPTYSATRYDMWQYSSKGRVSGIAGNVDMNICY